MYEIGTTVRLDFGIFYHYGIIDDLGGVIHNSKKKGCVKQESLEEFSEGRAIEVAENIKGEDPLLSVERAKQLINAPYSLFTLNCEHFVRYVHGMEKESRQIQRYLISIGAVTVCAKTNNPVIQVASMGALVGANSCKEGESPTKKAAVGAAVAVSIFAVIALLSS